MESGACMNCGAANAEHDLRYLVVDVSATSTTQRVSYKTTRTTTVTTEQFSGADRYVVCDSCIQKRRRSDAVLRVILGALAGFVGGILIFAMIDFFNKGFFNANVPVIMALCGVLAVGVAIAHCVSALCEPVPFVGQAMLRKARGNGALGKVYVPASREAYIPRGRSGPDLNVFHQKLGLRTAVGDALFLQVIAPGKGDQFVDEALNQTSGEG